MSTFTPELIGRTEKTLNAILDRELASSGVTEPQWVALSVTIAGGGAVGRDELIARVAGALHIGDEQAQKLIDGLAGHGLLTDGSTIAVTDAGRDFHARIRAVVGEITARMWGDLPADELETAARVLATILDRAQAELSAA